MHNLQYTKQKGGEMATLSFDLRYYLLFTYA